eukprot:TRINITY_DN2153_c0_g1_i1.p1 TRINITY_DN2153_c0_g1~~TRINITY_DN2153_c0_g1_i1.p1  ORF type:complete len:455 (+),score=89.12 TRINITY_DN2153_c0_g1_i1:51-1367(+)
MLKLNLQKPLEGAYTLFLDWRYGTKGKGKQSVKRSRADALEYWPLTQPYKKGPFDLKHRAVATGMTRARSNPDGSLSDMNQLYYKQRMSRGGFMVTEALSVSQEGALYKTHVPLVSSKELHFEGLRKLAVEANEAGTLVYPNLFHSGCSTEFHSNPMTPSGVTRPQTKPEGWSDSNFKPYDIKSTPIIMDLPDFKAVKEQYRNAAVMLKEAGFKGVNLNMGGGGLLHTFVLAQTNKRNDRYGGTPSNRIRYPLEIYSVVASVFGEQNVGVSLFLGYNATGVIDSYTYDRPAWLALLKELSRMQCGYVQYWPRWDDGVGPVTPDFTEFAEKHRSFLKEIRDTYNGTLIKSGYLNNFARAAKDIAEEEVDLVGFGRMFSCVPDLPNRLLHGASCEKNLNHFASIDLKIDNAPRTEAENARNYIDWIPADLPEEAPEVIEL